MLHFAIMLPAGLVGGSFICLMLALYFASPWISGFFGAALVQRRLKSFEKDGCIVMHNVILPGKQGTTVQVDHILFSPYGIFTIKAIAHAGVINGSLRDAMWMQTRHGQQYRFANPIRSSGVQCDVVKAILGRNLPIYGLVIFQAGKLVGTMPDNVIRIKQMTPWIKAHGDKKLGYGQVRRMSSAVRNLVIEDDTSRCRHDADFMAEQELESRLRLAKGMAVGSAALVTMAMGASAMFFLKGMH